MSTKAPRLTSHGTTFDVYLIRHSVFTRYNIRRLHVMTFDVYMTRHSAHTRHDIQRLHDTAFIYKSRKQIKSALCEGRLKHFFEKT